MPQLPAHEYIRQGQTPFFRLPTRADGDYQGARAVLLGVPFDSGVTYRPGARFAPYEVRRVSALAQGFHPQHRVDVFGAMQAVDGGNVALSPFLPAQARDEVEATVAGVCAQGAVPFLVGGDHSISLPAMRAAAKQHGPLVVVHVDAHLDTSGPEVWGDAYHHGTPIRHALVEGLIAPGGLHQVGIRAPWGSPEDGEVAASRRSHLYPMDLVEDEGIAEVARRIVQAAAGRPTYVTFDVDGVDPAFAPGTGTPVSGGLSAREALRLLRGLATLNLVGMDVVEVCPALDVSDITSTLAAGLLYEGLAWLALRQ